MGDETIGSPITLAELRSLGAFVRWQEVGNRVAELVAAGRLPGGYPIVPSRLPAAAFVDLCVNGRWRQVEFLRLEGSAGGGDRRIVWRDGATEKTTAYDWYGVAPAGYYTEWQGPKPDAVAGARLLDDFELAQPNHQIHSQALKDDDWPYLLFEVRSFHRHARWVNPEDMWTASYEVHAADPRVKVDGVVSHEPWFNSTIAVSHRWLRPDHPDPDGVQFDELMTLADSLGLHENQTFLIDYCSLPQQPRGPDETEWFHRHLPGFQEQFKYVTFVLNTGSADYSTRAWCMFELMLAAMSRAPRPTLLNHDRLDAPLDEARDIAAAYMKQAGWTRQGMLTAFGGGLDNASFAQWARNPINVALYNSAIDGRRAIIEKFENELDVTDPADRPLIVELIERLAFADEG